MEHDVPVASDSGDKLLAGELPNHSPGTNRSVARLVLFFILLTSLAFGVDYTIKAGIRSVKTSGLGSLNEIMDGRVNARILVSGSSRAQVQYDPGMIQRATGLTAYNIGRTGSHSDMQLALLKAYLRHNAKPDLLIHNLDMHTFIPTSELYDPAQYLPFSMIQTSMRRFAPSIPRLGNGNICHFTVLPWKI